MNTTGGGLLYGLSQEYQPTKHNFKNWGCEYPHLIGQKL